MSCRFYSRESLMQSAHSHTGQVSPFKLFVFLILSLLLLVIFTKFTWNTRTETQMTDTGEYSVVWITVPSEDVAKKLAHGLVEAKLAACVNIIPKLESVYWWQGQIETASELLLMVKTKTSLLSELIPFVKKNHPYTVPEIISARLGNGNPDYYEWIRKNTK
jgi:periplasmic divalent cation tolerance protein